MAVIVSNTVPTKATEIDENVPLDATTSSPSLPTLAGVPATAKLPSPSSSGDHGIEGPRDGSSTCDGVGDEATETDGAVVVVVVVVSCSAGPVGCSDAGAVVVAGICPVEVGPSDDDEDEDGAAAASSVEGTNIANFCSAFDTAAFGSPDKISSYTSPYSM